MCLQRLSPVKIILLHFIGVQGLFNFTEMICYQLLILDAWSFTFLKLSAIKGWCDIILLPENQMTEIWSINIFYVKKIWVIVLFPEHNTTHKHPQRSKTCTDSDWNTESYQFQDTKILFGFLMHRIWHLSASIWWRSDCHLIWAWNWINHQSIYINKCISVALHGTIQNILQSVEYYIRQALVQETWQLTDATKTPTDWSMTLFLYCWLKDCHWPKYSRVITLLFFKIQFNLQHIQLSVRIWSLEAQM